MKRLGSVHHISRSGKLILRTGTKIKTGRQVFNEELKPIGRISDVFGPVKSPYVSIEPKTDALKGYVGRFLYVM